MHAQRDQLQVQQHVDDVFLHAFYAGVLVQHTVDLHLGDRRTGHRREQHAPQRVAERVAEAALERFDDDSRLARRNRLHLDHARLEELAD